MAASRWWTGQDGLVFRAQDRSALHPDSVTALVRELVATSGLPPARLHDLRHVHATRVADVFAHDRCQTTASRAADLQ